MKKQYILSDLNPGSDDLNYMAKFAPTSLFNLVPYLTCQLPTKIDGKYSATSLFTKLKDSEYNVEGVRFTGSRVIDFYKLFYYEDTKTYMKASQTAEPNWSSAVPIIMYMYKLQHNISYEEWDKSDPYLKRLLGKKLEWLVDSSISIPDWSDEELQEIQLVSLTTAATGVVRSVKSHIIAKRTGDEDFDNLPRLARFMLAQIWLYSLPVRTSAMITNHKNWDKFPPAFTSSSLITEDAKIASWAVKPPVDRKAEKSKLEFDW
jgi:hypothetical protein